jgi:curved DNA-binding protein CbpA
MREASAAYEASTMNISYDILGVPRSASEEAIRAAFHSAAKACHPDLNAGDPAAAQKLKQIIDAYNVLKSPERRAAYDELLRDRRRALARRFATSTVASLAGGGAVLLGVWMLGALPHEQIASAPSSAPEWEHVEASRDASRDPSAIAPPSHANASEPIKVAGGEQPQLQEPIGVTTKAAVREEPSAQDLVGVTIKAVVREEAAVQERPEGDAKSGHEEPAARKLVPATAARRLAKGHDPAGHDPARPVTADIRSPAFFGVAF